MTQILPVPKLPSGIKEAVDQETLAVFIGAGVSRILGCAGWEELAKKLADTCHKKGYISFKEQQALNGYSMAGNHKKTVSVCKYVLEREGHLETFYQQLGKCLEADPGEGSTYRIYEELYLLRALFVTTNIDEHFDRMFTPGSIACREEEFRFDPNAGIDRTRLYHLHGSITDRDSLVLTVDDYFRRYQHDGVKEFLQYLFSAYRVLFVGYGLAEFELLEYVMTAYSDEQSRGPRHWYLMPLYAGEDSILELEQSYFGKMGIEVVPYAWDKNGWDQVYEVICHWQREINMLSSYLYKGLDRVEELAASYEPDQEEELFQLIKNDLPLEEHFFKVVSSPEWLSPLLQREYFAAGKNPRPVESEDNRGYYRIPYWNVLDYLQRLAEQISSSPDSDLVSRLMDIVRSVSDYRDETGQRIDNYHTDWAFVKMMANMPVGALRLEDMERVGTYLVESRWRASDVIGAEIGKSLLPTLLQQGASELSAKLLEIVIGHQEQERAGQSELMPLIDGFWLDDILKRNTAGIQRLFPLEAAQIALREIDQITAHETSSVNLVWIPAVEEHPQNRSPTRYENILVRAARDFLDAAAEQETEATRSLLHSLLSKQHPIFPRIALNCISRHWLDYSDLFWPLLEEELLTQVWLKHELYQLLKVSHTHFSDEQMEKVLDWIETRSYHTPPDGFVDEADRLRRRAAQKLEWLTALKESDYDHARQKYLEYLGIVGGEPEHPGFSIWMGDVQVGCISPVEVDELLQMPNTEIASYLTEYCDTGEWYGVPSKEGLADTFKAAVTAQPQKFVDDLAAFLELPPYYLYYLLWGLNEACKAKHDFDWEPLLSFCLKLADTAEFWAVRAPEGEEYPGSLVSQAADLLEAGTRDDSHAFDQSLLPLAEKLLIRLLEQAPSQLYNEYDILTAVLNSPKGRVLSAAVHYSLRYARVHKDEDPSGRWAPAIKEDFSKRLDRAYDATPEFSATAGQYLANLHWLHKGWVISHIDDIFPKDNQKHWRAAMAGYLWPGRIRRDLFLLLREHGHYAMALQTEFGDENLRERLIQHVVIAYLWGDEQLEDSKGLLGGLLDRSATADLHKAVAYLSMQREPLEAVQRERVVGLWRHLVGEYRDRDDLSEEERLLLIDLAKLASHLDSLDTEVVGWLRLSVRHFRTEQDAWPLIEDLHRLVQESPGEVAVVYLEILDSNVYPTFDQKHIVPIVATLYERGQTEAADRICNSYGSRGVRFLRSTHERYHSEDQDDALA